MREWLVIESSAKNAVFASDEVKAAKAYDKAVISSFIPRDVAEGLLGRDLSGRQWFTAEEGRLMRAHPQWRSTPPAVNTMEPA